MCEKRFIQHSFALGLVGGSARIGMDGEQLLARCCKTHLVLDLD